MHHPFPTDRRSLIRCVRAFVAMLAERLTKDCDVALPNGQSMDRILSGLALHEANWDATVAKFALDQDEGEPEWFAEIADTLREIFDDLSGPSRDPPSPN